MKKTIYFLEFLFFKAVAVLINLIPYSVAVKLGRGAGISLSWILPKRYKIARDNLRASYPEKTEQEIDLIAKGAFASMGQVAVEFVCIPKLIRMQYIKMTNAHFAWDLLKLNRGVIWIVSHHVNWEAMAIVTGLEGFPASAIARPLKNPYVYEYIKKIRGLTGVQSVDKSGALRFIAKLRRENKILCFLIDQHERQGAVITQFFGRPCYTSGFAARIALKWDIPVIATHCRRDSNGIITMGFDPPFQLIRTGDFEKDVQANTQMYVNSIERHIREQPENWLWMHRRWRV